MLAQVEPTVSVHDSLTKVNHPFAFPTPALGDAEWMCEKAPDLIHEFCTTFVWSADAHGADHQAGDVTQATDGGRLMKIVVLDGYTLNPGDQSWSELEALGECQFYDRTDASELIDRAQGYDIVITNKVVLGRGVLERLPRLRYIGVTATGYNVVRVRVGAPIAKMERLVAEERGARPIEFPSTHRNIVKKGRNSGI